MSREVEYAEERTIVERLLLRVNTLGQTIQGLSKHTFLHYTILCIILAMAAILRLFPIRWGFYLSEFDPYFQFRMTDYIVENGFSSWYSWHDNMSWYPWGRDIVGSSYPGLAFTASLLYGFLKSIGIEMTVHQLCTIFPVIMGALTCFALYFLSKEIWGKTAGLFSALFLAFSASHIFRTSLGFFDDETIGIFSMVLAFLFFLRAIQPERSTRSSLFHSLLAGLCISYLSFSWGAFRYPIALIALFSFVLVLIGRGSSKLTLSFATTYGLVFLSMAQLPWIGYDFFRELTAISVLFVFLTLIMREISSRVDKTSIKTTSIVIILSFLIIFGLVISRGEILEPLAGKFLTVLNPSTRTEMPLVESVAEHRLATWATFFHEFGAIALLGIFGLYFVMQKLRDQDIFLILFGISSLYFAASLVRLSLILAPAISILAAITLTEFGKPAVDIIRGTTIFPKKRIRFVSKVGKECGIAILLLLIILIVPTINGAVNAAQSPATIATSSLPTYKEHPQDWLEALAWMRENLPEDAVVFSWWDYGYWITTLSEKRTLADNGTLNSTQISMIARAFLSNETQANSMLKKYDVTHIAILVTWYTTEGEGHDIRYYGFGEDSKWYWMARISNGSDYEGETINYLSRRVEEGEEAFNYYDRVLSAGDRIISNDTIVDKLGINPQAMLGDLIFRGISQHLGIKSEFTDLVFASSNYFVFVYSVKYPEPTLLSCNLSDSTIAYGQSTNIYGKLIDFESNGIPSASILLQHSKDNGTSWDGNYTLTTNSIGEYEYELKPKGGEYMVRASWNGTSDEHQSSSSPTLQLKVMKTSGILNIDLSPSTVILGENVSIFCNSDPPISRDVVGVEYSSDEQNWTLGVYGFIEDGTFSTSWTPENEGTFFVRARVEASENFEEIISETKIVNVVSEES